MSPGPRVVVIAQARMGSSRLPGKVLQRAGGRTLLEHLVRRVRRSQFVNEIVIATTTAAADDELELSARELGVPVFRGSEDDVLSRYAGAAAQAQAEVVVRVTGDCPLLDEHELDRVIESFLARRAGPEPADYATNQAGPVRRIPRGLDVEVMSREALDRAQREALDPGDREHVTPYLYREPGRFRTLVTHYPGGDFSGLRLTVDTPEDLALIRALLDALGPDATFPEVAEYLTRHPELRALNAGVSQKSTQSEHELRQKRVGGRLLLARADAGEKLGYGHVARTFALLEAWVELGGEAELVGVGIEGRIRERVARIGTLTARAPTAEQLLEHARARKAAAIVLDGYHFTSDDEALLGRDLPLLVWDDLAQRTPNADVVLNQNLGARADAYAGARGRVLAGAPYLVLRREFRGALASGSPLPDTGRVVVAFGASDPAGQSPAVARALRQRLDVTTNLIVVVGSGIGLETRRELEELAARANGIELVADPPSMVEILRGATVAVLGAGSLAWEALALGLPCVLLAVAENQGAVVKGAVDAGAALDAGRPDAEAPERIAALVAALLGDAERRRTLGERARRSFDGRGCFRVVDALLDAIERRQA